MTIRVYRSLTMKVGLEEGSLDTVPFSTANSDTVTDLVTDDLIIAGKTWWTKKAEIILRQDKPNPLSILSIVILSEVID